MIKKELFAERLKAASPYPVLGETAGPEAYCPLDLSVGNARLEQYDITDFEGLGQYVRDEMERQGGSIAYGGYGEDRLIYWRSPLFNKAGERRTIHLGLDLWLPAYSPVFAPLEGRIHSFADNNRFLDYGATIILEHELGGILFYSLYGHLSRASLRGLAPGKAIPRGAAFAELGPPEENGGWAPHLHFQLILDMKGRVGDFPGVASRSEAPYFLSLCPGPGPLAMPWEM